MSGMVDFAGRTIRTRILGLRALSVMVAGPTLERANGQKRSRSEQGARDRVVPRQHLDGQPGSGHRAQPQLGGAAGTDR